MRIALKEWAAVIRALERGKQIFILRKGGLAETQRGFELKHSRFVFYPTWEHQQSEQVQPPYRAWVDELEPRDPQRLLITAAAEAVEVLEAPADRTRWQRARDLHIWNDDYVRMRYEYRPDLPLRIVLLRVSALELTAELPVDRRYGGCRSWVELYNDVRLAGALPALDDRAFAMAKQQLCNALEIDGGSSPN